ncbi:AfsR/SARP family transcriptional regulator [Streptomyces purpurogeneiscleroticus]|uniref:AfsR/SARP family transcriptional regulator n=1 Tax=Streptomyces purpurogeneiscleroticus TaxID=68259 RepID=UPI001CBE91C0|nr:AfsR/SARP family transcriptional regulator [Streptomyces purpurogeneiscleroticus]MBZ4016063.1 hypothetical protein [Streptomyces purpurogeneiscleroticus]
MAEISVLGPFSASVDGVSIVPSATKPRQVLALLALQQDRITTCSVLMEELWGENIPKSARTVLQTYIVQLRKRIAAALGRGDTGPAKKMLVTRQDGYLLRSDSGWRDYEEFDRLVDRGRKAATRGDDRDASENYRRALGLWKGPALVDVRVGSMLELERLRLEENRMAALEQRIDADLRLGLAATLIPELSVLAARYPLHENFCAQLMTALHRAGNSWRALEAYQRLRHSLARELGVEPSVRAQRVRQSLLAGEDPAVHVL